MNERIDEIAFDAGCHRHKYWDPKHPDLEGFIINQAALDKFAEFIVRECIEQGKQVQSQSVSNGSKDYVDGREMGIEVFMNQIKNHFGVES